MTIRRAAVFVFALGILPCTAHTQDRRGAIHGRVLDAQGAAIPKASVEIACGDAIWRLTADGMGRYQQPDLPLSRCTVAAGSPLFERGYTALDVSAGINDVTLVLPVRRFTADIVVTPSRGLEEATFGLPESMSVTSRREIDARPYQLLAQVLQEEPGILVQQTTSAQVSPIIRGFTGQSNVYLIDGARLNTASWRPGPSQYVAWVDAAAVDRIEVIRGSGSVQYGSDALGGAVNLLTAVPIVQVPAVGVEGSVEVNGGIADRSAGGHAEIALKARAASIRIGAGGRRFGDLRAGGGRDSHAAVTRFLGLPSTVTGNRLPGTGFDQTGGHAVALVGAGEGATLRVLYMRHSQDGATRYDRLHGGEGVYRSGFDPQRLDFGVVRYQRPLSAWFDGVSAAFSINRQADGRFEQARPTATFDTQTATTTAFGYQVQGHRQTAGGHHLVVGGEFYDESISAARQLHHPTGAVEITRPDIADGTTYTNLGLFAQSTAVLVPDRLSVRGGVRYGSFGFAATADPRLGVTAEEVTMRSLTFQAATVVKACDAVNVTFNVSRGFRAANAADLGSIGLTGGGGFEISPTQAMALGAVIGTTEAATARSTGTAVPALRPEVVYQYEGGVRARTTRVSASANVFDMEFFDAIQRRALVFDHDIVGTSMSGFPIVSQDAAGLAYIAQDIRPITTRVNVDRARIRGFDAQADVRLTSAWTASGFFSMSLGRLLGTGEFMRRMPPPMGGATLRWVRDRVWTEGVVRFAAEQTRLSAADLSDARIGGLRTRTSVARYFNGTAVDLRLVRDGILVATGETLAQVQDRVLGSATSAAMFTTGPGFATFGLRAGVRVRRNVDITALGENLTDVNYRLYGSGVDAAGATLELRVRYRF